MKTLVLLIAGLLLIASPQAAWAGPMGASKKPQGIYGVSGGTNTYGVRRSSPSNLMGTGGSRRLFAPIHSNNSALYGVQRNLQNITGMTTRNFFSQTARRFF